MKKTLRSRVAAVAVAALGAGLLSAAPAFAGSPADNTAGSMTLSSSTTAVQIGGTATTTLTVSGTTAASVGAGPGASGDTSKAVTVTDAFTATPGGIADPAVVRTLGTSPVAAVVSGTSGTFSVNPADDTSVAFSGSLSLSFTPTQAGKYTITFTNTAGFATALTAKVWTVYVGYSVDALHPNNAFATQGTNIATGWEAATGGQATVRLTNFDALKVPYYVTVTGGTIVSHVAAGLTAGFANTANYGDGIKISAVGSTDDYLDVTVTSTVSGDVTVLAKSFDAATGIATTHASAVAKFNGVTSTAVSTDNSTMYVSNGDECAAAGTNAATDRASIAAADMGNWAPANAGTLLVCLYLRDASNRPVVGTALQMVTTLGAFGASKAATATFSTVNGTAPAGYAITGSATQIGKTAITVISTQTVAATVKVFNGEGVFFGPVASLALANSNYAAGAGVDSGKVLLTAKDAAGQQVDLAMISAGVIFTVDSDYATGAPADGGSDSAGGAASYTADAGAVATYGANRATVSCVNSVQAEKLTLTAWAKDKDGLYTNKSGTITFYCSGAAKTVEISTVDAAGAEVTKVDKGGTFRVQVKALDKNGYPVADGTVFSVGATNAATVSNSDKTTRNGAFRVSATTDNRPIVTAQSADGVITLTVVSSGLVFATKTITVGTGTDAAAAANTAIAAVQAQVNALQTAMAALVASTTATLTSLTAKINKIMKKLRIK